MRVTFPSEANCETEEEKDEEDEVDEDVEELLLSN
jgi:hypothetical protein